MSFTSGESTQSNETFGKDVSFKLHQLNGSMSISPSGRDVVLGSKEGLHIIDLDSPYSPPRFLPHRTPWEVADVQWSPFADRDYWVVSTSNQKALVWNLEARGWRNSIEHVLHGHTRAITDINFSAHHKDVLATCAVDSFVQCWDLRTPDRPAMSFSDWFAGATQVKYSRQDEHVLASSHDKFLHIWDDRKGAYPIRTIEAHNTKIYGIDWNRFEPSKIVTCSLDKTIKFWDTDNPEDVPDRVIETSFPVWRARHTPFGWGLMVMPQRGNGNLHLYDRRAANGMPENGRVQPVHVFPGHKGQVREFLWRAMGTVQDGVDHRDFQLVTWGTDRELRLHAVSQKTFEDVGFEKGVSRPQRLRVTRKGAKYRTFRDEVGESDLPFAGLARFDSFLSTNQLLRLKGRRSTNFGMSKASLSQFKGWLQAGKGDRRTGMHGKGAVRPDTDPISWMKNVKIASTSNDALADEITQVGEKFKKVEFETVDMSQRRATLSLQSPLGEQGLTAYTRVDFRFPKAYPREAQALTHLQRMNSLSQETYKKISSDMQKIAEAYLSRGRGCIEAVVRYLLREQSLDQIIDLLMRDSMMDSKLLDVVNLADDASDDSDDDQLDSAVNATNASADNRVPLAKRCGAMWSDTGKLVCFFLPKNTEPASLLSTLGTGQLDEPDPGRLFGGFGKFQMDTSSKKQKDMSTSGEDEMAAETSDDESLFSTSSSSLSSDSSTGFDMQAKFVPWQRATMDSVQRSKSAEGSQKSTNIDGVKNADTGRKAFWVIHDMPDVLPSKELPAKDYRISGEIVSACDHNAKVAAKYEMQETANVWALVALAFNRTSADQIAQVVESDPDFRCLAQRLAAISNERPRMLRRASTMSATKDAQRIFSGGLLGPTYLIPAMLEYFERTADVQMLAILSAILILAQENLMVQALKPNGTPGIASRASFVGGPNMSNPSQISLRTLDGQFRPSQSRGVIIDPDSYAHTSDAPKPREADLLALISNSLSRTGGSDHSGTPSGTPSVIQRDPSGFSSAIHSGFVSISTSPETHRVTSRRSDFSTATASLYALARQHTGTSPVQTMHTDRQQYHNSSKSLRVSPDDSYLSDSRSRLRSSFSLANASSYPNESTRNMQLNQGRLRSILKHNTAPNPTAKPGQKKKRRLKTRFNNSTILSNELCTTSIVLPFDMYPICLSYIKQYVDLLEVWRLWTLRAEMQQLYSRTSALLYKLVHGTSAPSKVHEVDKGLEIRRCCQNCNHALIPVEKNGVAIGWDCVSEKCMTRRKKPSRMQKCCLCEIFADGLTVPCLNCGHLTCYDCAQEWFLQPLGKDRKRSNSSTGTAGSANEYPQDLEGDRTCPTGCGCACPVVTSITISNPPNPEVEMDDTPSTSILSPRSEPYQELSRAPSIVSEPRSHRVKSVTSADNTALNALLALNLHRTRSISSSKAPSTVVQGKDNAHEPEDGATRRVRDNSVSVVDELLPWSSDQHATLGKGVGGGLSRGLRNVGSDATIRRV